MHIYKTYMIYDKKILVIGGGGVEGGGERRRPTIMRKAKTWQKLSGKKKTPKIFEKLGGPNNNNTGGI